MRRSILLLTIVLACLVMPLGAHAYIGPGGGLSALGTVVAFLGAVLLAILGFVWYPLKRLLRRRSQEDAAPASGRDPDEDDTDQ